MNIISSSLFSNSLFIHPTNIYSVPTITGKHLSMDHFFKKVFQSHETVKSKVNSKLAVKFVVRSLIHLTIKQDSTELSCRI